VCYTTATPGVAQVPYLSHFAEERSDRRALHEYGEGDVAPSAPVEDIQQGKEKAAVYAQAHLIRIANLELPTLVWKRSRAV
jgi:hypothetical protein